MKKKKTYLAKSSAQFDKEKVQIYAEELQRIAKKNRATLTPKIVVDEAREKISPLHECFEWDEGKAAEAWRRQQARHIINHIEVVIEYSEYEPKTIRAFVSLKESKETERNYVDIEVALDDENLREMILKQALAEFINLKNKYEELSEFINIFKAIDGTQRRLNL